MIYSYINFINIFYYIKLLTLYYFEINAFVSIHCGLYTNYITIYFITFEAYIYFIYFY